MEENEKKKLSCSKEKRMLIAYKLSKSRDVITGDAVRNLWEEWYPEDKEYFDELPYKWDDCYNWISRFLAKHTTDEVEKIIQNHRIRQKRTLNKKCKNKFESNAHVVLIKSKIKDNRLAKYLLLNGAYRRTGDYGSLVAYINNQKKSKMKK